MSYIRNILQIIWKEPIFTELKSKKINVSIYKKLKDEIPDDFILIEEVFSEDELIEIWNNFKPHLEEYGIFPFLGTLGGPVICIGYKKNNLGKIFYHDFDFGCFSFDNDKLSDFLEKLIDIK